jgi:hypothetical protein
MVHDACHIIGATGARRNGLGELGEDRGFNAFFEGRYISDLTTPSPNNLRRADRGGSADDAPRHLKQHRDNAFGARCERSRLAGLPVAQSLSTSFVAGAEVSADRWNIPKTVFKKEYGIFCEAERTLCEQHHANTHERQNDSHVRARPRGPSSITQVSAELAACRFIGLVLRGGLQS